MNRRQKSVASNDRQVYLRKFVLLKLSDLTSIINGSCFIFLMYVYVC